MFVKSHVAELDEAAAVLAAMLDPVGAVNATVKLAKGSFAPAPNSDPTTFTEADFTGYTNKTITSWQNAYLNQQGVAETVPTALVHWQPTGTTITNLVTGYWLMGSNGDYLGGESFLAPVPMGVPTDSINLVLFWQWGPAAWASVLIP